MLMLLGLLNGSVMLISPRRWFLLPRWVRAQGTLTPERYSTGRGAVELRVLGAVTVAFIVWVAYDLFGKQVGFLHIKMERFGLYVGRGIVASAILLATINAVYMLVSPQAWFRLPSWLRAQGTLTEERYGSGWGAVVLRLGGGLILLSLGWFGYALLR